MSAIAPRPWCDASPCVPSDRAIRNGQGVRDGQVVRDGRHRLVCRWCGRTEEVGCAIGDLPCLTPARAAGFAVDEAEVVFWGLCPACKS